MPEALTAPPRRYQSSTSWTELVEDLYGGATTSKFRVGAPGDGDAPTVFRTYFPPGFEVPVHTHACDYAEIILDGSQQVTKKWHHPGDIRIVKAGTAYGPLVAGPEGVTVLLIFRDGRFAPIAVGNANDARVDPSLIAGLMPST